MILEPFKIHHLEKLEKQKQKTYLHFTEAIRKSLENSPHTMTLHKDGRIYFCGGLLKHWPGRYEGWAVFDRKIGQEFITIHRMVKRYLELVDFRRIECVVNFEFSRGHRWAKALGFEVEASLLKRYFDTGEDAVLYARVK